jgi:hypothetical protein
VRINENKSSKLTKNRPASYLASKVSESPKTFDLNLNHIDGTEDSDPVVKSKGNLKKEPPEKRKDYQLNHMFKIINFLEEDEGLNNQREKFREKMR